MDEKTIYEEFCTGCGLCHSVRNAAFRTDPKGFPYPQLKEDEDLSFCDTVCPASGAPLNDQDPDEIWGKTEAVCLGYAADGAIRKEASSGGVLTSLCLYLLESGRADGIIQTKAAEGSPIETQTVISRTAAEVAACSGSRYAVSSPLMHVRQMLRAGERYAFVGRPCDAAALRQYLKTDADMRKQIVVLLSFFCAGMPSRNAQERLLAALQCREDDCVSLRYRGDGWPGYAAALRKDGKSFRLSYNESWGRILGRDIRKICRFCMDGLGEAADIACGDAWYLTPEQTPDFTEHDGRNVVFARTAAGAEICREAAAAGRLILTDYPDWRRELKKIQAYQYARRADMEAMFAAMRCCRRAVPSYASGTLRRYGRYGSGREKLKRFLGTVKRLQQGKI